MFSECGRAAVVGRCAFPVVDYGNNSLTGLGTLPVPSRYLPENDLLRMLGVPAGEARDLSRSPRPGLDTLLRSAP